MKLVARVLTALALVAFATPALPCGDKTTTASTATKTEKKDTVAKSDKKADAKAKTAPAPKSQTATN